MIPNKKFVFVLMPFDEKYTDVYKLGIKESCSEKSLYCERVDEQNFSETILDRIFNQINKADIIIAEVTEKNPNVYYEIGYAHGLGKEVILCTSNASEIPFDFKHFPHIIYTSISKLKDELKRKLDWVLSEELHNVEPMNYFNHEFLIDGQFITENNEIVLSSNESRYFTNTYLNPDSINLRIDIENKSSLYYDTNFKIGLEIPNEYKCQFDKCEFIQLPSNKILLISKDIPPIYPSSFAYVDFIIMFNNYKGSNSIKTPLVLKVFAIQGVREIPFYLKKEPIPELDIFKSKLMND